MAQINIGDTVRFLNSIGGGRVTRIKDNIAYVADDDGFEQPVLLRECVVVAAPKASAQAPKATAAPARPAAPAPSAPLPPIKETEEGENPRLTLGFEPSDLKRLSQSSFDAYLVNDSNFWLHYTVATRERDANQWTLRAAATLEPGTQDFLFELTTADLPNIDRMSVQVIMFKQDKEFALFQPITFEHRFDATRFARLHCFQPNPYFDVPVIAFEIPAGGQQKPTEQPVPTAKEIAEAIRTKTTAPKTPRQPKKAKPDTSSPLEIDLHATEILESIAGMSSSEILNYQIDTFRRIMDENLRNIGRKIIFIHGNGEGVLRRALMKELNYRYKGHQVVDASFREYGFGAMMVTIRNVNR